MCWRNCIPLLSAIVIIAGCSPKAGPPVANTPPAGSNVVTKDTDEFGNPKQVRNNPTPAMAGGAPAAAAPTTPANNNFTGSVASETPAGLPNGLYPQGLASSAPTQQVSGSLSNGLYPQVSQSAPSAPARGNSLASSSPEAAARGSLPTPALAGGVPGGGGSTASSPNSGRSLPFATGGGQPPTTTQTPPITTPSETTAQNQPTAQPGRDSGGGASAEQSGDANEFFDEAKRLFASGDENNAVRNLYAYALSRDDVFESYPLQYYPGLMEPKLFLRWGIGVTYTADRDFDDKPPVIGDPLPDEDGRGGGAGRPDDGGVIGASGADTSAASNSPYAGVDTATPAGFLLYYTGDYIEKLYKELNSRRVDDPAYWGSILAGFSERIPIEDASTPAVPQGLGASSPEAGRGRNLPTAAAGGGGGGGGPPAGGGGGGANPSDPNQPAGRGTARKLVDVWSGSGTAAQPERMVVGTLLPGVICLGEGKKDELISRAKGYGVDLVLVFDVKVGEARGSNYTTTTLRLFNTKAPEKHLALGKALKNTDVMESRRGGSGGGSGDRLMNEINRVMKDFVDANFKAQPMPETMKPEHVEKRIETILAGEIRDPLAVAVEVVGFYRMGLLLEAKAVESMTKLLGTDGDVLLNGSEEDRVKLLKSVLARGDFD